MRKNRRSLLIGILFPALIVGACGGSTTSDEGESATTATSGSATTATSEATEDRGECLDNGEPRQVSLALPFPFAVPFFSVFVADARNYFEEEGLQVEITTVDGSAAVVQQVVAENVEFGMSDPGPIANAVVAGEDLRAVYVYQTGLIYALVTEEGAPFSDIADLAGENIGVSSATAGEFPFLQGLLASNGIDPESDVNIIETGDGGPSAVAFQQDRIAAYFSDYFNIIELGSEVDLREFDLGEFGLLHGATVVTQQATIDESPELVSCLGRALARASEFTHASPEAALTAIASEYPDQVTDPEGFDLVALNETIARTEPYDESDGRWGWNRPESWQGYVDFLSARGELPEGASAESFYTNDFVDSFNDFDEAAEREAAEQLAEESS